MRAFSKLLIYLIFAALLSACSPKNWPILIVTDNPKTSVTPTISTTLPVSTSTPTRYSTATTTPTTASLGSPENPIIWAAYPGEKPNQHELKNYQDFASFLSEKTSLAFRVVKPASFEEEVEGLLSGNIHVSLLSNLEYLVASDKGLVEAALLIGRPNEEGLWGIQFIANAESGIAPSEDETAALQQFEGKTPCWDQESLTEDYVISSGILARAGVHLQQALFTEDSVDFFKAIYEGRCDFGTIPDSSQFQLNELAPYIRIPDFEQKVIKVYATEGIIPRVVISYANGLPETLRERITAALLEIASTQKGWGTLNDLMFYYPADLILGMMEVDDGIYDIMRSYAYASGIDLENLVMDKSQKEEKEIVSIAPNTLIIDVPPLGGVPFLPFWENSSTPLNRLVLPAIYAELVRIDASGHYIPYLAAEIPSLDNGLARFVGNGENEQFEVEFRLRPNARWQDGKLVTAEDLVFSWELVMGPDWPGWHWGVDFLAPEIYVDAVEALTSDSVVYRFMSQRQARQAAQNGGRLGNPTLYASLAQQEGPIVPLDYPDVGRNVFPKHILENIPITRIAESEFAQFPVYAGAYRIVEGGQDGQPVVMEAFDGFILGTPSIERVIFGATYKDETAAPDWQTPEKLTEAMQSGRLHAQLSLPAVHIRDEGINPQAYDALAKQTSAIINWIPRNQWEILDFNLDNEHLSDIRVRQAIAFAIDRQGIINQVFGGRAELKRSYLLSLHPLYAGDSLLPGYDYNPEQARVLLREAGYDLNQFPATHLSRGPLILKLASMDVTSYPRAEIADQIRENLSDVGIKVDVLFYEWQDFEAENCSGIRNGRQFDLGMAAWVGGGLYPVSWVERATASWNIPKPDNGCPFEKSNWTGWHSTRVDEIIPQLKDGRLMLEQPELYRDLWAEHQGLWATELPSLPLFNMWRPVVYLPTVTGVQPSFLAIGSGVEDTWNIFAWDLIDWSLLDQP